MMEGRNADDKYRVVEDEFVVVAGKFTAHLHRAEYERLKNVARSQNAETIATIARPVVGSLTEMARKRQENVLRRRKQTDALRKAKANAGHDDSGDESLAPWKGTALHGLMESRAYDKVPLARLIRSGTSQSALRDHRSRSSTATLHSSSPPLPNMRPPSSSSTNTVIGVKRPREEDIETEGEESDDPDDLDVGVVNRPRSYTTGAASKRPTVTTPVAHQAAKCSTSAPQQKHQTSSLLPPAKISRTSEIPPYSSRYLSSAARSTPLTARATAKMARPQSDSDDDPFTTIKKRRMARTPEASSTPSKAPAKPAATKAPSSSVTANDSSSSETDLLADFMKSRRKNGKQVNRPPVKQEEAKPKKKMSLRQLMLMHY